ncbi:MAG: 4a-hydroxytetrahydrobiopterin dehydratase [Roseiflexaceae bacterium]|nr:4a-hydroxytetrahydrobiopterin dehydratase [Roseiflexaceae bacterium]
MSGTLSEAEITSQLDQLSGWSHQGSEIRRTFQCAGFPAAIAFVTQVGFLAEAAAHHPDIDIRWQNVTLALTTHDVGGLSQKDFDLARQIDTLVG